jgi:urea transporter
MDFGTDNTLPAYVFRFVCRVGAHVPFYMKGRAERTCNHKGVAIALNFYLAVAKVAVLVLGTALQIILCRTVACALLRRTCDCTYGFTYPHLIVTLVACLISLEFLYKHRVIRRIYSKKNQGFDESAQKKQR